MITIVGFIFFTEKESQLQKIFFKSAIGFFYFYNTLFLEITSTTLPLILKYSCISSEISISS